MRQDQIQRLQDLQEKLADVVLDEADPEQWPGAGVPTIDMTQQQRGDRYWSKKNAAATFMLLERTTSVLCQSWTSGKTDEEHEADIDKQIAKRELEASKLLDNAMKKARKSAFDERTISKK